MTEEEKLEKAKPFLNGKFWAYFESSGNVSAVAINGYLAVVTKEFVTLFGYNQDECHGMHFRSITDPMDYDTDELLYQSLLRGEREQYTLVKRYIPKRGERFDAHLIVRALHDDSTKELVAVVATIVPKRTIVTTKIMSSTDPDTMERNAKDVIKTNKQVINDYYAYDKRESKDKSLLGRIGEWSLKFVESVKGLNLTQSLLVAFLATLATVGVISWYYLAQILEAITR